MYGQSEEQWQHMGKCCYCGADLYCMGESWKSVGKMPGCVCALWPSDSEACFLDSDPYEELTVDNLELLAMHHRNQLRATGKDIHAVAYVHFKDALRRKLTGAET